MGVFSRGARRWGVIGSRARAFQPDADEPLFSIPAATRAGSTGDGLRALVWWRVVARVPTSGDRTAERPSTDFMCVCVPQAFLVIGTLYREAALRECFSEADQSFITGVLGPYDSRVSGTGGAKAVFSALNMLAQVFQPTRVTAALRTAAKTAASSAAIASAAGGAAAGGGGGVVPPLRRRLFFPFVSSRRARHVPARESSPPEPALVKKNGTIHFGSWASSTQRFGAVCRAGKFFYVFFSFPPPAGHFWSCTLECCGRGVSCVGLWRRRNNARRGGLQRKPQLLRRGGVVGVSSVGLLEERPWHWSCFFYLKKYAKSLQLARAPSGDEQRRRRAATAGVWALG